ncbi:MAG: glycogen synthase GlgA [Eubacteriales bacterium]|nr:glycogen synthase GlgA [Eubacteriales bacterium]
MKILFLSSEMAPFAKSGGLGDVVGALPRALRQAGHDARVILPLYKKIKDKYHEKLEFRRWAMLKLGWRTMYSGLFEMDFDGLPVYFIDNEYYFGHENIYIDYDFDIERFSFYQRAVLECLGEPMGFKPDILHCNDWQSGMVPVLLEAHYKQHGYLCDVETVLTIHNLKYQGIHGREKIQDLLELPDRYFSESGILKDGVPNFLKSGIQYANRVTTVSPTYASEIMMDYYGEGLNGLLGGHSWKLVGLLNGIDTKSYNPETDTALSQNYRKLNWKSGKTANKLSLASSLDFAERAEKPLLGMVSRLCEQKGLDLLLRIADELLNEEDVNLLVLGTGDAHYEQALRELESRHPDRCRSMIMFDEQLARQVYAATDFFLMPSIFEPCGLSQLIAMRYGALPIVRETGGLKDTVLPYNEFTGEGTGFSFANINAHEFLFTIKNAIDLYWNNKQARAKLVRQAMSADFSWQKSAANYAKIYRDVLIENGHLSSESV